MLFISTTFLEDNRSLNDALSLCDKANIHAIEIGSNHLYEKDYNYIFDYKMRYLIHNYFPIPKESFVVNIASFNNQIRERSISHIKNAINFCSKIGSELYTFHPGFLTDPLGSNISKKNYDFQWDQNMIKSSNRDKAEFYMYSALDIIVEYAKEKSVKIAIETEGSISKKDHLLMQYPNEYRSFMKKYNKNQIGINLNIGHLNLASKAFSFSKSEFVDLIWDYIVAMELSHNEGVEDDHLPLIEGAWYWGLINDKRFSGVPKILEFRNTGINKILKNIKLIEKNCDFPIFR